MRTSIVPRITDETAGFWEGARNGELRAQRCDDCGALRFPPQPMCPQCRSLARSWGPLAGKGVVYTYSIVTGGPGSEPLLPGQHGFPYAIAIIELEEGVRMVTDMDTEVLDDLKVGMPVEVVFEKIDDDISLPRWVPVGMPA